MTDCDRNIVCADLISDASVRVKLVKKEVEEDEKIVSMFIFLCSSVFRRFVSFDTSASRHPKISVQLSRKNTFAYIATVIKPLCNFASA